LIDSDGFVLADGSSGFTQDRPSIFSYLVSDNDRDTLREAMANANQAVPQAADLTFCFLDKTVSCHCHIYKGKDRFLISGWQMPDNIRNLGSYITINHS
jgi:hypothetical protein